MDAPRASEVWSNPTRNPIGTLANEASTNQFSVRAAESESGTTTSCAPSRRIEIVAVTNTGSSVRRSAGVAFTTRSASR
jgi:hypothetical protein